MIVRHVGEERKLQIYYPPMQCKLQVGGSCDTFEFPVETFLSVLSRMNHFTVNKSF